jgi:hypothetical protein
METAQHDNNVHVASLALVGCYLTPPPTTIPPVPGLLADNDASLRKWSIGASFDSATLCQNILLDGRKLMDKKMLR